jgi:hypothetical protein
VKLTKRMSVDALGQPIGADTTYTALEPFNGTLDGVPSVWNPRTPLRGDSPAVKAFPDQFVPVSTPRDVVQGLVARRRFGGPPPDHSPAVRILQPIPPERRMVAIQGYYDIAGRYIVPGDIFDSRDDFVQHNRHLFKAADDAG